MNDPLLVILLSLFGGIGGTLLWEGLLGPLRIKRSVARSILAETSLNMELMAITLSLRKKARKQIPGDFSLISIAFNALTDKLGFFPPVAVHTVIHLYANMESLNSMVLHYLNSLDKYKAANHPYKRYIQRELDTLIEGFYCLLEETLKVAVKSQQLLYPIGESWRCRRNPIKIIDASEVDKQVAHRLIEREKNIAEM